MFLIVLAAGLILSTNAPQAAAAASEQGGSGVEAAKPAPEAKAKENCRYVKVTGHRGKRRVCSDNPERDAAIAAGVKGPSSTIAPGQQGNINTN